MPKATSPIPAGYRTVTPYLILPDCAQALDFYRTVLGAEEMLRLPGPGGKGVGHAEIRIGDSIVMLADGSSDHPVTRTFLIVYVADCDAVFSKALAGGATVLQPLADKFYGDRSGSVRDPFGQDWAIATHIEDVPPEEMADRAKKAAE